MTDCLVNLGICLNLCTEWISSIPYKQPSNSVQSMFTETWEVLVGGNVGMGFGNEPESHLRWEGTGSCAERMWGAGPACSQRVGDEMLMRFVFVLDLVFSMPWPQVLLQLILQLSYEIGSICNIILIFPLDGKKNQSNRKCTSAPLWQEAEQVLDPKSSKHEFRALPYCSA